jgi:hypothetical protein
VQVAAAVALLEKLQSTSMIAIESRAPVRTTWSGLLPTPGEGVGLYERTGWKPGDRGQRAIVLTRTSGPAEPMTFSLKWEGNDATFTSADRVTLPLKTPVPVPVSIAVKDAGAHSAILLVEHPSMPVPAHRVLATIVAATPLSADNKYSATATISVPKPTDRSLFVDVPRDVSALMISAKSAEGLVRLSVVSPDRENFSPCGFAPTAGPCAIARPLHGVWEINVANNDLFTFDDTATSVPKPKQVTVAATALHAVVDGMPSAGWAKVDGAASFPVRFMNRLGAAPGAFATGALGSAYRTQRMLRQGEQHMFEVIVPKGASSLRARVTIADTSADLDVYLFDCTVSTPPPAYQRENGGKAPPMPDPTCAPRAKAAGPESGGEVSVAEPKAGRWVVVVDAYSVRGASVGYDYLDMFTHPRFGTIATNDGGDDRSAGSSWTSSAHAWAAAVPDAPRSLVGRIEVAAKGATRTETSAAGTRTIAVPIGAMDLFPSGRVVMREGKR